MLASEYVRELQRLIQEHGDHEMVDSNDNQLSVPEFFDDGIFVAAEVA